MSEREQQPPQESRESFGAADMEWQEGMPPVNEPSESAEEEPHEGEFSEPTEGASPVNELSESAVEDLHEREFSEPTEESSAEGEPGAAADDLASGNRRRGLHGWKKGLLIAGVVLVALVAAMVIAWKVLDSVGRSRLYEQGSSAPTLTSRDSSDETGQDESAGDGSGEDGILSEEAAGTESEEADGEAAAAEDTGAGQSADSEESVVWEADWVRYNGTVYDYNENILTFLVMGIDHNSEVSASDNALLGGQADALFLLVVDPDEEEISILSINRATMVPIDVYSESDTYLYTKTAQICLAHGYGNGLEESCERQVEAVSELLYGLGINGYVSINMSAIPVINNSIGGVTLTALEDVPTSSVGTSGVAYSSSDTRRDLVAGETYTLSGFEAYAYTKYRSVDVEDSASGRARRQKQYLQKFVSSLKSAIASDITVVTDLYRAVSSYMVTDLDLSEVTYLASNVTGYSIDGSIYELSGTTITGEAGSASTFDEFYVNDDALYELMLELFYTEVEGV